MIRSSLSGLFALAAVSSSGAYGQAAPPPQTLPNHYFKAFQHLTNSCSALYTVPYNRVLVIQGISADITPVTNGSGVVYLTTGSACQTVVHTIYTVLPQETLSSSLGTGLAFPAGTVLSAFMGGTAGSVSDLTLAGYIIKPKGITIDDATPSAKAAP